ncbi:MAG: DUF2924 domain-containing protein [Victivallaceae bacterium]|nr:DUF2924 domain-containing protein [Victivallaceae bacterium]
MTDDKNRTSVLRQLTALKKMTRGELDDKWRDLYGSEPPSFRRAFLERRLAYRIQELFYGGLEEPVREKLDEIADKAEGKKAKTRVEVDGRILPGTRFTREWNGKLYETIVREDGFEYNGQMYRSLSAIATAITGTQWNGRKWWGLPSQKHKKRG